MVVETLMKIKPNIPLAPLTTFGIGGNAKFFVEVSDVEELKEAVKFTKENKLPIFVLGGGSNILISDNGFDGLVVKMDIRGLNFSDIPAGWYIRVGAGEMWDNVVAQAVELNAGGIENLSLIPGTAGGAVYQNIGAYGSEIKDVLIFVQAYDISIDNIVRLSNEECDFEYRSSIFKKNKNLIVLEAELLLPKNYIPNLLYSDLQNQFNGRNPTITEIRQAVIEIRLSKIPYQQNIVPHFFQDDGHQPFMGNAGSFFKNPIIKISNFEFLISKYLDLKGKNVGNGLVKLSAGQLIEKCGFQGKRFGNVGVSAKHALILINYGGGTSKELAELENIIETAVKAEFGIELEKEVEKVAF
mgnify:CR=1 FL=1